MILLDVAITSRSVGLWLHPHLRVSHQKPLTSHKRSVMINIMKRHCEKEVTPIKLSKEFLLLWCKRLLVYFLGLFIMAIGVVFSVRSSLGVSPVTCLANVTYQIFGVSMGITPLSLGVCTTLTYCVYILVEVLILRKDFQPQMLLQVVASTIFGFMVTLASNLFSFLPVPQTYVMRLVFLILSIPMVALGVMLYLAPNILPTPGEGLSLAVSKKIGKPVATCKMIVDCCLVLTSAVVSFVYFHGLVGVREGTLISALMVGFVMKRMMRVCNPFLLKFVERETKLERAIAAGGTTLLDRTGRPKLVITISREFGSGGYDIGKQLAEKLGITFYDKQLEPMEAEESGLPLSFIQAHEQRMAHNLVYDFLTAGYAMYNEDLPPMEKLFAAQTRILRRIAASDESCVIMGRCSDYILYNDPNSFRIFIHAPTDYRARRISETKNITLAQAYADIERTDIGRSRHYQQFAGREWGNTKYYNLAVDTALYGVEGSVKLIDEAIRLWCEIRGYQPEELIH